MAAALFAFSVGFLLIGGSTRIDLPWLSYTQFAFGIIFLISGVAAGWTWSRDR